MDTLRDAEVIATNIRTAMQASGHNPNSFSRITGISRTTLVRHLEGNDPGFTLPQLAKIASVLGTTAGSFYHTGADRG